MNKLKGKNKKWGRCDAHSHGQGCSVSQNIKATPVNRKTEKHLSLKREWNESETNVDLILELNKDKALIQQMLKDYLEDDFNVVYTSQRFEMGQWVDFRMRDGCYIGCRVSGYANIQGKLAISLYEEDLGHFVVPPPNVYECEWDGSESIAIGLH